MGCGSPMQPPSQSPLQTIVCASWYVLVSVPGSAWQQRSSHFFAIKESTVPVVWWRSLKNALVIWAALGPAFRACGWT